MQNRLFEDYAEALCAEIDSRREEIAAISGEPVAPAARSRTASDPSHASVGPSLSRAEGGTSLQQEPPASYSGWRPRFCAIQSPKNDSTVPFSPDTLYIGGGTPSVLPLVILERIVRALGPATYEEFTVEVNPDDIVAGGAEYVTGLRALGVNRVSMGVQSFDDGILRWMNRRHDAAGAREAFRLLRAGGFDNVSIDLIFGLSQLTEAVWESTIKEALALGPEHISAYQLSIEEDSALERMVADGRYMEASDEQCRGQYDILCRKLADTGYVHYEVSNWARPGREAVHNSAYWRRVPYVGLGPGAHSFSPGGRSWNRQELPRREADGRLVGWRSEREVLSEREAAEETVMLGLRTATGLPLSILRALSPTAAVDALLSEGALQIVSTPGKSSANPSTDCEHADEGLFIRIPEDRFFVSDDIISRLLP
ncbi:MAG: coproporphyrinogen III oxidase family protein [Bacteroidales bacterium]|nr:coproporphyrinogen III oxidase family protein [Bacteroidales bacterium]